MRWYLNFYAFADSLDGITVWLLMPIVKPQSKPLTEMKLVEDVAKELESIVSSMIIKEGQRVKFKFFLQTLFYG
jgi:hypothetical protein